MIFDDAAMHDHHVRGTIDRPLLATDDADNEENTVRLGEQMIREVFRKWREKK
jgi:hypothetical protein